MDIKPYKSVGGLYFTDNYNSIKNKLQYSIEETIIDVAGKQYPQIYVKDLDLIINFKEEGESIRYFEFYSESNKLLLDDIDITKVSFEFLLKKIKKEDKEIIIEDSSFESKKYGINVSRKLIDSNYLNEIDTVLIYSKEYSTEPEIDLDELYKSIMGDDYNPDTELSKWK